MKLPGAYKNRDKRNWQQSNPMVRMDCPGCDWMITAPFAIAEQVYQKHLVRFHDFPAHIAPRKDPQ